MESSERSVAAFLEALGSDAPAPGGGAASALVGALAAALTEMVARFTVGRKKYAAVEEQATGLVNQLESARRALLALADADERAYQQVAVAYQLPKVTDVERAERDDAIQAALRVAMQPPLRAVGAARAVVKIARVMAEIGNGTVVSDAGCAAILGAAAARAAALNVQINAKLLDDRKQADAALDETRHLLAAAQTDRDAALALTYQRMGVEAL